MESEHRSGFVSIIGKPNVGKSTLMNELVDAPLSIITAKAQTTRHRIKGIVNTDDYQIVYSDTPGVLDPAYKLQEGMMNFVYGALEDADIILFITEIGIDPNKENEGEEKYKELIRKIGGMDTPLLIVINKIDLADQEILAKRVEQWQGLFPKSEIIPISALHKSFVDVLHDKIVAHLPEGDPYFPKDEMTDKPLRFFVSEIIREKIFLNFKQEVPYSCEVETEEYKEEEDIIRIRSIIYVSRDSQKGIIIGHQGKGLKRVGTAARKDIEAFVSKKVFLELYVKVDKDWRTNQNRLKNFGYLQ